MVNIEEEHNTRHNSSASSVECEVGSTSGETAAARVLITSEISNDNNTRKKEGEEEEEGVIFESEGLLLTEERNKQKENVDRMTTTTAARMLALDTTTGAVYIPPSKRRQMKLLQQEQEHSIHKNASPMKNTNTLEYQRENWETLKKQINGTINRLNSSNIKELISTLFQKADILRGRGVLCRSILKAIVVSPYRYSPIYAALLAVINTKLPEIGELCVKRCIIQIRRCYTRKDKSGLISICVFVGHLLNQHIVHELLALEIITVLIDGEPSDDSVEVCIHFLQVIGKELGNSTPKGLKAVMSRMRNILHEGIVSKRIQLLLERLFKVRQDGFQEFPSIEPELDIVEEEDQITFELSLDEDNLKKEEYLDVFKFDEMFDENEKVWMKIRDEILGVGSDEDSDDEGGSSTTASSSDDEEAEEEEPMQDSSKTNTLKIEDLTETTLINLRRTIYLTIMSSASYEECAHKLSLVSLKQIPIGAEHELINMIIECCSQERTYLKYYGFISQRFCLLEHGRWNTAFTKAFEEQYMTIHRLETNKLRNVAKLFAHLLTQDAVSWNDCLCIVNLNEDETTSSSRIFLKIILQTMAEYMGIPTLQKRFNVTYINQEESSSPFKNMFPMDNPRDTRYAINFYTSIGLGPLTDGLREYLKIAPKLIMEKARKLEEEKSLLEKEKNKHRPGSSRRSTSTGSSSSSSSRSSYSSGSSSSSSSYTSSSSSSSSYSSSSSDDDDSRRRQSKKREHRRTTRSVSYSSRSSSPRKRSSYMKDRRSPSLSSRKKEETTSSRRTNSSPKKKDGDNDRRSLEKDNRRSAYSPNRRISSPRRRKEDRGTTTNRNSPSLDLDKDSKKKHRRRRSYSSSSSGSSSLSSRRHHSRRRKNDRNNTSRDSPRLTEHPQEIRTSPPSPPKINNQKEDKQEHQDSKKLHTSRDSPRLVEHPQEIRTSTPPPSPKINNLEEEKQEHQDSKKQHRQRSYSSSSSVSSRYNRKKKGDRSSTSQGNVRSLFPTEAIPNKNQNKDDSKKKKKHRRRHSYSDSSSSSSSVSSSSHRIRHRKKQSRRT